MRFFCIPDIVEDHPTYNTKTKSSSRVKRSSSQSVHSHNYVNGHSNGQIMGAMPMNRSRSSLGSGGRRLFGERKHSSIGGTGIGQAFGPISGPISAPVSTVSRASSATHRTRVPPPNENQHVSEPLAHTHTPAPVSAPPSRPVYAIPPAVVHRENGPPVRLASVQQKQQQQQQQQQQRPPPATYHHHPALANNADERHRDFNPGGAGMITDSDREYSSPNARMRKSRRMSAPLAAALGLVGGNRSDMESGNESGTSKKLRRVSKVTIGPPEGFRHEGHVGVGEAFLSQPPVHDSWNVETWRSEIERPKHSATISGATTRPRGPRPASVNPPPSSSPPQVESAGSMGYRKRGSMDSTTTPRRSTDREREREKTAAILDGAMTEPPLSNRPGALVPQGRASPTRALVEGEEGGYSSASAVPVQTYHGRRSRSRSRSGSNSGSIGRSHQPQPPTIVRTNEPAPPPQAYGQQQQRRGSHSSRTRGGHLPGQDSITSLASNASNPTSQSSHATTATNAGGVITPATSTSLSRSASDKPYHPPQAQNYLHHNAMHYAALQQAQKEAVSPLQLYYKQQEEQQRSRSKHQQSQSLPHVQPQQAPSVSKRHYQSSSYGGGDTSLSRGGSSRSGHHSTQHQQQQQPPPNAYNHGYPPTMGVAGANLTRAASANAAITPTFAPSSTSSTATAASMASSSATLTPAPGIYGAMTNGPTSVPAAPNAIGMNGAASASSTTVTGRKSVPIPRRKPVPQHLPATAEVSPFPSMFVDSSKEGGDKPLPIPADILARMPTLPTPASKDETVEVTVAKDKEVVATEESGTERENQKRWRDKDGKSKKEMVPLLGVPGDNARYVTETTKAKWDGNMSEIVEALRDPNATPPV